VKKIHENNFKYRNGDHGVKYLMRGPSIDWGVILLKPGEYMGEKSHGHEIVDETFYFVKGDGVMIVDDIEHEAKEGTVVFCEPKEYHNIRNDSDKNIKIVFIKSQYLPDDKI